MAVSRQTLRAFRRARPGRAWGGLPGWSRGWCARVGA